ncbi:hypothetical protein FAD_1390 [Ferroplasma acidiphilum]|jgi:hypothetical protein|uniref:Uncharacterized protein n=2 Tax=Ferroplasma TaxID=74968 RepID=S0ANW8_FERAC|nr:MULTISPECIES: hypothetical protein [Ferroplasma]AGO60457.1 hypothetical protein FACI_IFERC00001G0477 [Ferroplasma acidarmanus Fer1]ARD85251.1 hypothetical protein FAD_1390 [Ferroplasma acidiphilum]MCL4349442.1 hypothetical protein [Candidatus Thermoplasmatota archaeon]
MNKKKVIIGVLIALIFVMIAFVPAADNMHTVHGNAAVNKISPQLAIGNYAVNGNTYNNFEQNNFAKGDLNWKAVNLAKSPSLSGKPVTGSYAAVNNKIYTQLSISNISIAHKYTNKITEILGSNYNEYIKTTGNSVYIKSIIYKSNQNTWIPNNSMYMITGSHARLITFDPHTYHKSYGWGNAYVFYDSDTFYGSIGARNYYIMLGLITTDAGIATDTALIAAPEVAAVAVALEAVVVAAWAVFTNDHISSQGTTIPYVEFDVSVGNWWDFWDTGIYGELGAHSNRAYNFNGNLTYSGQWAYFPFLTTAPPDLQVPSLLPHSSVWPTLSPPW